MESNFTMEITPCSVNFMLCHKLIPPDLGEKIIQDKKDS